MKSIYHKLAKISLVCVYLIIVAGSVVRMTGSGMGCPDWPKCFGYYIPPTSADVLEFKPNFNYKKGQVIQIDKVFHYAKQDFTSGGRLNIINWKKNTTHEYNTFNVTHTWIEYINRLLTVVAGIPIFLLFITSLFLFKKEKILTLLAFLVIVLMGFEAWLGKTVVDSNLMPTKISVHLGVAFLIVLTLIYGVFKSGHYTKVITPSKTFKKLLLIAFSLTIVQIVLGIQVRQMVDLKIMDVGYEKSIWLEDIDWKFYVHRTFSIVVLLVNFWLFYINRKDLLKLTLLNYVILILFLEILTGVVMVYLDFPLLTQPLHLVMSGIILGLQFMLLLQIYLSSTYLKKQANDL